MPTSSTSHIYEIVVEMFVLLELLVTLASISMLNAHPSNCRPPVPKLVYEFPNSTYSGGIENIGITTYGHLLLNTNEAPHTYLVDPNSSNPTAFLVATYPDATICLGIAEISKDTFAIVAGNWTSNFEGVLGSFSIWLLDVAKPNEPKQRLIARIPEAQALNGMTTINGSPNLVLVADSMLGVVWSVNLETGSYTQVIMDPLFANTTEIPIGINGLHAIEDTLYFTNTALGVFRKVGITGQGMAAGAITTVAKDGVGKDYDDFAFDHYGNAFIANHPDTIVGVTQSGFKWPVAKVSGPTSAVFAKEIGGSRVLYVPTIDGKVYSVDVC